MARAKQRLELITESSLTARVATELANIAINSPSSDFVQPHTCPVCDEAGLLYGDYVVESVPYSDEDGYPYETLTIAVDYFLCETCGLTLDSPELVQAADLPDTFEEDREVEVEWDDYGND